MVDPKYRLWREKDVCRVVNKYHSEWDVNIQRGTIWGNHFSREEYGDQAIPMFEKDFAKRIRSGEITIHHLETLRGMKLGCTCKPLPCHGDIIAKIVNKVFNDEFNIEDL